MSNSALMAAFSHVLMAVECWLLAAGSTPRRRMLDNISNSALMAAYPEALMAAEWLIELAACWTRSNSALMAARRRSWL